MGYIGPDLWDLDGLASYSGGFYPEKKMRFSIVTPSFKQLDYLECCIASVADQGVTVEHIVQDAGSPGIEEFAEKTAERLLRQYGGERVSKLETYELLHLRTTRGYTLRIFKEKDSGMYDAVNKGLERVQERFVLT